MPLWPMMKIIGHFFVTPFLWCQQFSGTRDDWLRKNQTMGTIGKGVLGDFNGKVGAYAGVVVYGIFIMSLNIDPDVLPGNCRSWQ
jgi:hypothetical protein